MLMTSNVEMEPSRAKDTLETEPPKITMHGDGKAIPEAKAKALYKYKRGAWSKDEDEKLRRAVEEHGVQNWIEIEKISGLARPAKNCRLRWFNYLRPNLKRYPFTQDEEKRIILLHSKYGNSWSRIASKLPGRSDNEIKNFCHKRTKRRIPIDPTRKEESDQNSKHASNSSSENHSTEETNYLPDNTLPSSSSIHSQEFQLSELNVAKTPTSQLQKLLLSPHQISQSCQSIEMPSESSNAFTFHRNPPILSSPNSSFRRFGKAGSQLSPHSHSVSGSASSLQRQSSLAIESPRTPLKLKLSPGVPAVYSVQMIRPTIDSPVSLQSNISITDSTVQLNTSTSSASLSSPQLNPTIQPMPFDTDHAVPVLDSSFPFKTELPSIQSRVNNSTHKVETDSDLEILDALREAQTRVRFLKKKLRLSNKRNWMNKNSRKESFLVESQKNTDSIGRNSSQSTTKECSSRSRSRTKNLISESLKVNTQCKKSRTEDLTIRISKSGVLVFKNASNLKKRENSENEDYSQDESTETEELIQGAKSGARTLLMESLSEKESITYEEQRHSIDPFDDLNSQNFDNIVFPVQVPEGNCMNECSSIEDLLREESIFLQDSFSMGDSFGQTTGTEGELASQEQVPLTDSFGPTYLVKSGDENSIPSYHQPYEVECFDNSFGREFPYAMERYITEEQKVMEVSPQDSSYMVSEPIMEYGYTGGGQYSVLSSSDGHLKESYESSLLQHQDPMTNLLHSGYVERDSVFENELPGSKQYSIQTGFFEGGLKTECTSSKTLNQDPSREQGLNQWYSESGCGNTGEILGQELEYDSLLEYFTTTIQTPEWYSNGNKIAGIEASAEFNTDLGLHTYPEGFANRLQKMESSKI